MGINPVSALNHAGFKQPPQALRNELDQAAKRIREPEHDDWMATGAMLDEIRAMDNILNAFTRPTLAEQSQYQYSKGGSDVSGPSIRSAEAIAQLWGNIEFGFREITRGTGAGQINQDANGRIDVNVAAISTDSTAADSSLSSRRTTPSSRASTTAR